MFLTKNKIYSIAKYLNRYSSNRRRVINYDCYEIIEPALVSSMKNVPSHIKTPNYYATGEPWPGPNTAEIKNKKQIEGIRSSCKLASTILKNVGDYVKIGKTTDDIDTFVHEMCIENNCYPSPLRYRGFPKSICTSVNNVAVHGIPDNRPLKNGDIVNVDITVELFLMVYYNGYHGDCSKTFLIGDVDEQGKELVSITEECLLKGISICAPGTPFKAIGWTIHNYATKRGFVVVPAFIGHGIGRYFHGAPEIHHTLNSYPGKMKAGMTFTIEPVITLGEEMVEILEDGWTAVTADGARAAQTEHTVLITENGCEILTDQH